MSRVLLLIRVVAVLVVSIALPVAINTALLILYVILNASGRPGLGIGFVLLPLWIVSAVLGLVSGLFSALALYRRERWHWTVLTRLSSIALVPGALLFFLLPAPGGVNRAINLGCGALTLVGAILLRRTASRAETPTP